MPFKDAEAQRAYQREYQRLRRAGSSQTPSQTPLPVAFRLQKVSDVLGLLEEQVQAVRGDTALATLERARCLGYLSTIALRAIETGEIAQRVEAVELALKMRKPA